MLDVVVSTCGSQNMSEVDDEKAPLLDCVDESGVAVANEVQHQNREDRRRPKSVGPTTTS
jgi:hypothetical protein